MYKLPTIFFILLLAGTSTAVAQDLYSGEVLVTSQSEAARNDAMPSALIQVLQKLSGRREIPNSGAIDDALQNADEILLSFQYKNVQRIQPDGSSTRALYLVARFMRSEVDRILLQAGLPRWQTDRPVVQVWVVIDDGQTRSLRPLEYQYAWQALQELADRRGLQVSWPELDAEEIQLVDMQLVWGGFADDLARWGAPDDSVLIIAARREGPRWVLRWSLAGGGGYWSWHNSDQELMFALADGIHRAVDQIAGANTIAAADLGQWNIDVSIEGLDSGDDYNRCLAYLQDQGLVTAVDVLAAEPGRAYFRLQLNAAPRYLREAFQRKAVLRPLGPGDTFEYRFLH